MVIHRVPQRRIGSAGRDDGVANGGGHAAPDRVGLLGGQINKVISHKSCQEQSNPQVGVFNIRTSQITVLRNRLSRIAIACIFFATSSIYGNRLTVQHKRKTMKYKTRVGLFGIGLDAYWPQFKGLKARLEGYLKEVDERLQRPGVEVVNLGLIDTPGQSPGCRAIASARRMWTSFSFTSPLTPSLPPCCRWCNGRKVPVIILNLQPAAAIDYAAFNKMGDRTGMTGEWLAHCAACPVPEIANVFNRARIRFHQVTGMLHDDPDRLGGSRRLDRGRARGQRHVPQPAGSDGTLLRRHARYLFRPHPAMRHLRRAY